MKLTITNNHDTGSVKVPANTNAVIGTTLKVVGEDRVRQVSYVAPCKDGSLCLYAKKGGPFPLGTFELEIQAEE